MLGTVLSLLLTGARTEAETPLHMWSHSTEIGVVCSVEREKQASSASLCSRLARIVARQVAYPVVNRDAGAKGVTLHVVLRPADGDILVGTLQATRPALQDEMDSASRAVPLRLTRKEPDTAFCVALETIMPGGTRISGARKRSFD